MAISPMSLACGLSVRAPSGIKYEWNNSHVSLLCVILSYVYYAFFKYRQYRYIATPPINTIMIFNYLNITIIVNTGISQHP